MKKKVNLTFVKPIIFTISLTLSCLLLIAPISCRITEEGIEIVPADTEAPLVLDFSVDGKRSINITCSEKIVFDNIAVHKISSNDELIDFTNCNEENAYAQALSITYSEDRKSVEILLTEDTLVGNNYAFTGRVYDISGNSLEFAQNFIGYNENPAKLIINEIRNTYDAKKEMTEFVEFYVLKSGNLSGLDFYSGNKESNRYKFPSINVNKGEYITLHLQSFFKDTKNNSEKPVSGAKDELGPDLNLSKSPDSCDGARDLWFNDCKRFISLSSDILILENSEKGIISDMLFLSKSGEGEWSKKLYPYAKKAEELGIWTDTADQSCAVITKNSNLKRSVSRINTENIAAESLDSNIFPERITEGKDDWIVTESIRNGREYLFTASPGKANCMNPYI